MNSVGLIFPGGGVQYVGMGKYWYDQYEIARETFEEASEAISVDMAKLCFEGNAETLARMEFAQAAILLVSCTAYRVLKNEYDFHIVAGSGHSLGEYTALTCAGAISLCDAMTLIKKRGELLTSVGEKTNGTMMAVNKVRKGIIQQVIFDLGLKDVYISVENSPKQYVLSGPEPSLIRLGDALFYYGGESNVLNIDTTSHCPLMQEAADELRPFFDQCEYSRLEWPVISNLDASPYENINDIPETLYRNMTEPVKWQRCMEKMSTYHPSTWIDVGPKSVYRDMLKHIFKGKDQQAFFALEEGGQPNDGKLQELLSVDVHSLVQKCLQRAIAIPLTNTSYTDEEFDQYLKAPYKKLQELESEITPGDDKRMNSAFEEFTTILQFKGLSEVELKMETEAILNGY